MRDRTPDSTTPASAHDAADSWVWFVTEKGLRASGAAHMRATAASLRATADELESAARRLGQEMPPPPVAPSADAAAVAAPQMLRRCTISYRYRNEHQVPELRLGGKWLRSAGFDLGQKVAVKVDERRLTICAEV